MRNKNLLLISLLIVALLPYLVVCFYAIPFADDFCYGWTSSEKISFAQKFLKQYLHWNGRYTSDILLNFHPLITGQLCIYQIILCLSILATIAIVFVFIRQFVKSISGATIATLFIVLFYFCYQPNITEGLYWYVGIATYHLGNLCFILQLILFRQLLSASRKKAILLLPASLVFLIASVGFNEIGMSLIPVFYLAYFIIMAQSQTAQRKLIILHFMVALIASSFVFFSPGNYTREGQFPMRFHILHSLLYASLQTIRFIGTWAFSFPFIALSVLVIAKAGNIQSNFIKRTDWKFILFLLLFTVFSGSFLPYLGTGILGQHRTINYVFFYFIFLWVWLLVAVSEQFSLHTKLSLFINDRRAFLIVLACIIVMITSGNCLNMLRDFRENNFANYSAGFMQRQTQIIKHPEIQIPPLKNIPATFRIVDTKADSTWWVDKCMKKFYGETSIVIK